MIYTKKFSVDDFEWTEFPRELVERIRKAGKVGDLSKILEEEFDSETDTFSDYDIDEYVSSNAADIMQRLGLTIEGKPIRNTYKVFYRVTAISHEEIEAGDPEEAREKFLEEFDEGDPLHCINRDDIETVVPIAYEGDEGDTKDYGPSEESRRELENSLVGIQLFALVRLDRDQCGTISTTSVRMFASLEEAKTEMCEDYLRTLDAYERVGNVDMYKSPADGVVEGYVMGQDKTAAKWDVVHVANGIERSSI